MDCEVGVPGGAGVPGWLSALIIRVVSCRGVVQPHPVKSHRCVINRRGGVRGGICRRRDRRRSVTLSSSCWGGVAMLYYSMFEDVASGSTQSPSSAE